MNNKTNFKGVTWDDVRKKYIARTRVNGKNTHIGQFDCAKLASEAYIAFKREIPITLSVSDKVRLNRFKIVLAFCQEGKRLNDCFKLLRKCSTATVRFCLKQMVAEGYLHESDDFVYTALKSEYDESKFISKAKALQLSLDANSYKISKDIQIVKGARLVTFDNSEAYKQQRIIDRQNLRSPKNFVSGSSLLMI